MRYHVRRRGLSSWAQWQSGKVSWALCIARWQFSSNFFQAKSLVDSLYHAYKKDTTFEPLSSFVKIVWIREQQVHRFQFCFYEFHEYISVIKDVHIVWPFQDFISMHIKRKNVRQSRNRIISYMWIIFHWRVLTLNVSYLSCWGHLVLL